MAAQHGMQNVYPWATAYFHEQYPNFTARWNDLVALVMVSINRMRHSYCSYPCHLAKSTANGFSIRCRRQQRPTC